MEDSTSLVKQPLGKSSWVSKPLFYLQDFHCFNVNTNVLYTLSKYTSYNNFSSSHLCYISSININQDPRTYKQ